MKAITAIALLNEFGPCTPSELKRHSGLTQVGVPFASRLSYASDNGYATKKKAKGSSRFKYAITPKGKELIEKQSHEIENLEQLKTFEYSPSGKILNAKSNIPLSPKNSKAIDSFIDILESNREAMDFLRTINREITAFLERKDEL